MSGSRGQAYSVEGVLSALLIASALVLGLGAVNITPFTGDDPRSGEELRTEVDDVLTIAEEQGALAEAATCLGGENSDTPHRVVTSTSEEATELGELLNNTLGQSVNYNVYVNYTGSNPISGTPADAPGGTVVIGSEETPSETSVTVTRQVLLFESDPVWEYDANLNRCVEHSSGPTLGTISPIAIYMPNVDDNNEIYNVVQIRVVAWR